MDDQQTTSKPVRINRWLPYWAVFQADMEQTMRSWVYRVWVLVLLLGTVGYLLYRVGLANEARLIQPTSDWIGDLLLWIWMGSVSLLVVLGVGSISSERGTMADSVLSRGISRYQYFLGKLHARLVVVLCTFGALGLLLLVGGYFFLHEDHSLSGTLLAVATVAAMLTFVISCGVTTSAIVDTTLVGVAILWMLFYGGGFLVSLLPGKFPLIDSGLRNLSNVVRGYYDADSQLTLIGILVGGGFVVSLVGMVYFSRKDV